MNGSLLKPALLALILAPSGAISAPRPPARAHAPAPSRVHTVLTAKLPPNMNGNTLRATLITVRYRPGDASPPHTHACPVMVYVLEGAVRSQIQGQPERIYRAGESFYEAAGGEHLISANASDSSPARFLAFFVSDHNVPLSTNLPQMRSGETR